MAHRTGGGGMLTGTLLVGVPVQAKGISPQTQTKPASPELSNAYV